MADTRFAVNRYLAEGWSVLPIPKGEKGPRVPNWQNTTFDVSHFSEDDNIGVRLGEPSGGLTDVDLDCAEAIACAREILLNTQRIHGRPGKPASHYWYIAPGAKSEQFKDVDGNVLVELRSTGGQTVLPPSTHPSGELLAWEIDKECGRVDADGLRETVALVATAALLARHWPKGSRHIVARDAAGFLASRDIDPRLIECVIASAAKLAGDNEVTDRARVARDSAEQFKAGGKTTGLPSLKTALGDDVVKRLRTWFGGANESVVDEMNLTHFVASIGNTEVIATEYDDGRIKFQRERDLALRYKGEKVQTGTKVVKGSNVPTFRTKYEVWCESPRRRNYRDVVFKPNPLICHADDFNLWRGFAVEPAPGSCDRFLEHTREIVCSGIPEHYDFMLDLLALTVQLPGTPSEIAIVLRGQQGTGKGVFVRSFGSLFGPHFLQVDKSDHITGKFNSHLSAKVVLFADEAVWSGDKRDVGALKRLITEPTLTIERKGIDAVKEDNCVHLFMATNEKWSAPVGFNERRFFILNVSDARMQDQHYFEPIYKEMEQGGRAALLHFLLDRKFDRRRLRSAPKTDALREQQDYSLSAEYRWWKGCLLHGSIDESDTWPEWISVEDLVWAYLFFCDQHKINRRVTRDDLFRALRLVLPEVKSTRRLCMPRDENGRKLSHTLAMTGNDVRAQRRGWELPKLDACRAAYDRTSGITTHWPATVEPLVLTSPTSEGDDEL
jgi:hypothetical protein